MNDITQNTKQYEKLIWSIVHKLLTQTNDRYYYKDLENDLFQEGYVGLLSAMEKYDNTQNVQFSTFAYKYIYGYCLNYLKKEFVSLRNEDIDNSPFLSECSYEIDICCQMNLIQELNNRLKIVNKKVTQLEENILKDRLCNELSLQKCAERNGCSTKKVSNVVNKYKELIKDILTN